MMGGETLAEVRARLAAAMAEAEGTRASPGERSEVAEALERFLTAPVAGRVEPVAASDGTAAITTRQAELGVAPERRT